MDITISLPSDPPSVGTEIDSKYKLSNVSIILGKIHLTQKLQYFHLNSLLLFLAPFCLCSIVFKPAVTGSSNAIFCAFVQLLVINIASFGEKGQCTVLEYHISLYCVV